MKVDHIYLNDKGQRVALLKDGSVVNLDTMNAEQPQDPWKHRSQGMQCRTCMWFVVKQSDGRDVGSTTGAIGRCRRHAPTMSGFPTVFEKDWCGDHKLDENKV